VSMTWHLLYTNRFARFEFLRFYLSLHKP
jgi:hypothetical protein